MSVSFVNMFNYPVVLAFVATVVAILALRPLLRAMGGGISDVSHTMRAYAPPVVGGIAAWCAVAVVWVHPLTSAGLPIELLGLLALRLVVPANDNRRWGPWLVLGVDFLVCTAIVQQLDGSLQGYSAWMQVIFGVAILQGVYRLRDLDGLAAVTVGIGLMSLALVSVGTSLWLASCGAAAVAALLLFNLPARINRVWRVQLGQGGGSVITLVFLIAGRMALQDGDVAVIHLLWLLPIPCCELVMLLGGCRKSGHQRLLESGFSVTAIFMLYALVGVVPMLVLVLAEPSAEVTLLVLTALTALWLLALHHAGRLMWLLPWQLRRIDVPPQPHG